MKNWQKVIRKNAPQILTGVGISSMLSGTVMSVRATPKALKLILDEEERTGYTHALSLWEKTKLTGKLYIPSLAMTGMGIVCIISSDKMQHNRLSAVTTLAVSSNQALKILEKKFLEGSSNSRLSKIKNKVTQDKINKNPQSGDNTVITNKVTGETLFYDVYSGRYFKADIEKVRKAMNNLADRMRLYGEDIPLNEIYFELGLPQVQSGNMLGVLHNNGTLDYVIDSHLSLNDIDEHAGIPCISIEIKDIYPLYSDL